MTRLKCWACHTKWRWWSGMVWKILRLPRNMQRIFWKRCKSIAPAAQDDFRHVTKHVWMSRSATPARRNEATLETSKSDPFCKTHQRIQRHGHSPHADGCGRLRTVAQRLANIASTPRPPEWNGNPCYAFGKDPPNWLFSLSMSCRDCTIENAVKKLALAYGTLDPKGQPLERHQSFLPCSLALFFSNQTTPFGGE